MYYAYLTLSDLVFLLMVRTIWASLARIYIKKLCILAFYRAGVCDRARGTSRVSVSNSSCRPMSSRLTSRLQMLKPIAANVSSSPLRRLLPLNCQPFGTATRHPSRSPGRRAP
jgi:hypothetical protein